MERKYYVYYHMSETTGEIYYVGKGSGKRAYIFDRRGKLWDAFKNKHGCKVVIFASNLLENEAFDLEISEIKRLKELKQCRANISLGGDGVKVETRWWNEAISRGQIERYKRNPKLKGKESKTYKHFCDDDILRKEYKTLNTIQIANKYNVSIPTVCTRLKEIGVQIKPPGRKSVKIICETDGKVFNSINDAARHYGVFRENIRKVLKGIYKHTNKLVFKYA
jgi:hypothetical protein